MQQLSSELISFLVRYYDVNITNASIMVEDEWDYVEDRVFLNDGSIEHIAKELIDIYMVA